MIDDYAPRSGRMMKEDGTTVNIADKLGGVDTGMTADIDSYTPMTGRMIKEDGTVVNIAENIGSGGSGGTVTSDQIKSIALAWLADNGAESAIVAFSIDSSDHGLNATVFADAE